MFTNETTYPFLGVLKDNCALLRRDFVDIARFAGADALPVSSTAKRALRSKKTDWKAFGFMMHGKPPHQHMRERGFLLPGMDARGLDAFARLMERVYFRHTRSILERLASDPANGIISMWFSCFEPGARLGLHVNNDPYMYRAHVGVIVPEGDLGIKVGHEVMRWKEGEVFAFDPTVPHTAWNLSDGVRVVFIVDFFRPEEDRARMRELERHQFERMMSENPISFGMSGGYHDLDRDTIAKYALPWIG